MVAASALQRPSRKPASTAPSRSPAHGAHDQMMSLANCTFICVSAGMWPPASHQLVPLTTRAARRSRPAPDAPRSSPCICRIHSHGALAVLVLPDSKPARSSTSNTGIQASTPSPPRAPRTRSWPPALANCTRRRHATMLWPRWPAIVALPSGRPVARRGRGPRHQRAPISGPDFYAGKHHWGERPPDATSRTRPTARWRPVPCASAPRRAGGETFMEHTPEGLAARSRAGRQGARPGAGRPPAQPPQAARH